MISEVLETPFDYSVALGIRKIARFDYENRANVFYNGTEESFSDNATIGKIKGFEFLFEGEKKLFDFLIKFENLQEDFNKVCQILNIPKKILPKENSGNKKHYKEYYNSESFDIVSEKFSKDIETFNYKFE